MSTLITIIITYQLFVHFLKFIPNFADKHVRLLVQITMIISYDAYILILPSLREAPGEHISPEED